MIDTVALYRSSEIIWCKLSEISNEEMGSSYFYSSSNGIP